MPWRSRATNKACMTTCGGSSMTPRARLRRPSPVVDGDHGRIETRIAAVSTDIDWLQEIHLAHRGALAPALHDLQIGAPTRGLLAEIHGGKLGADSMKVSTDSAESPEKSTAIGGNRGTTLSRPHHFPSNQWLTHPTHVPTIEDQSNLGFPVGTSSPEKKTAPFRTPSYL